MHSLAEYGDVVSEIKDYFQERLALLAAEGVARERVVLDPGIGFAKRSVHNLAVLRSLDQFHEFGRPILLGASRKRIIGDLTGRPELARLHGTIATTLCGFLRGVHIFRVHDVGAVRDALAVAAAIENPTAEP
jgi:dihydropteroate synthase